MDNNHSSKRLKIAYLAGPYRGTRDQTLKNILQAEVVAKQIWKIGLPVLCPHKNTGMFDGVAPDDLFLMAGLEMLARCDCLILRDSAAHADMQASEGTMAELALAKDLGMPIFEWPSDRGAILRFAVGNKLKGGSR